MSYFSKYPHFLPQTKVVFVLVQFYPWFKFYFPLVLAMVTYDNEFDTNKNRS